MSELKLVDTTFEPTARGLVIHGKPTYENWVGYGRRLEFVEGAIQWLIGDWLNYGERKWGEMYAQAVTKEQAKTWRNYKWVSDRVKLSLRKDNLSWSHHQMVAPLDPSEQEIWLLIAKQKGWSANELRRQIQLGRKALSPELPHGKYRIIYADPPWPYKEHGVSVSDNYGGVTRHYPTMTIEEICDLPVVELAADDAVLFIWVTSPKLNQVWEVIDAWGFEYKTSFVWDKVQHNFGYYNSVRHELLLVCGRGKSTPEVKQLFDSVQVVERSDEHSEKPELFREIIETLYPSGRKIELFARKKVQGWESWGNQV